MYQKKDEQDIPLAPDLARVFPLPLRAVPEPWEDLASLLSRTAVQMGYKKVKWLLWPEDRAYSRLDPNVCFLREEAAYQYLGHLLQLNVETLYKLTFHRFLLQMQAPEEVQPSPTGYLQRPLFLLSGHVTRTLFLSESTARVCPRCLAEEPAFGILYWNVGTVVVCLKHHIFLIDCCPHCKGKIPVLRSDLTHCPRCSSGDYRFAPGINLPEEPLFLSSQALMLAHLGVEEGYRGGVSTVHGESPLYSLLPWQYFQLLKSFRNVLGPFFPNHPLLKIVAGPPISSDHRASSKLQLSLGEWATFALTFHALFTSWPDNFIALLESLPSLRPGSWARGKILSNFGLLYKKYLYDRLKDPAFAFLREAFEDYLKKRYRGGRVSNHLRPFHGMNRTEVAAQCAYMTRDQAMKILGVQYDRLDTLLSQGTLRAFRKPIGTTGKVYLWLIEKTDVEALREEWKDLLSLDVVAQKYLGINKDRVLALTRVGLLHSARGRDVDGCLIRYYQRGEIERLKAELLQYAVKAESPASEGVPLSNIVRSTGLSFVECLKEILGGHLGLIDTEREIPLFRRLVLSDSEVKRFLGDRRRTELSGLNLLSARDVMRILGVGKGTLQEWVRQGVIVGKNQVVNGKVRGLLFEKEAVDSFRRTYVRAKEAAELLDVSCSMIYYHVFNGVLHPLNRRRPHLFLREELEVLISPKR